MYVATHETSSQASGNVLLHNVYHHLVCYFSLKLRWPKNKILCDTVFNNDIYAHGIDAYYYYH